ncbi:hypothetical protein AB0H88_32445 [Nonomuraea sp. NPDC050680]
MNDRRRTYRYVGPADLKATIHSIVVVTEGESFRMRQARKRGPGSLTKK